MAIPFHKAVSSIESIQSTIVNDSHVYRWFVKFISHSKIKNKLLQSDEAQKSYTLIGKIEFQKKCLFASFIIFIVTLVLLKMSLLILFGLPIILFANSFLSSKHKNEVAKISCTVLEQDRKSTQLESQTLYQLCENYGTALNIPTLVDIIARQDAILRKTVIYVCVLTCFIYPIDFWNNWFIIFASFFLIQIIINTPLVFDHLK